MKQIVTARGKSQHGNSMVELAFLIPMLCMLLVGAIDMGRLSFYSLTINHAARAGVQYGAQNRSTAADNPGMQTAAANDTNISGLAVTSKFYCVCANGSASTCKSTDCSGSRILEYVQVDTSYTFSPLTKYPGLPSSYTVKGRAVMRVAN